MTVSVMYPRTVPVRVGSRDLIQEGSDMTGTVMPHTALVHFQC